MDRRQSSVEDLIQPAVSTCKRIQDAAEEVSLSKRPRQILRPGPPRAIELKSVPQRQSPPFRPDDKDGHYCYILGENLGTRFKILSKMGEGTFGRVLECWDRIHRDYVAIKIVRNIDKYRHAAMIELEVLNALEKNDPSGVNHCVALREWFDYRGHVCMVFERLGPSLFDFLRKNNYRPFPISIVQQFALQMLQSVSYLHELNLVHTDLKPENILLVSFEGAKRGGSVTSATHSGTTTSRNSSDPRVPSSSAIKVIDFGSATFEDSYHSSIVSTRHYRAPEVILSLGWSYPADMWSVGCIIAELVTGDALFQTHENLEHLAMMEAVLGSLPESLASRAVKCSNSNSRLFHRGRLHWPDGASNKKSIKAVKRLPALKHMIQDMGDLSTQPHEELVCDLIHSLLRYEPEQRMTAQEALQHPFFRLSLNDPPSSVLPEASGGRSTTLPSASHCSQQLTEAVADPQHSAHQAASISDIGADPQSSIQGAYSACGGDGGGGKGSVPQGSFPGPSASGTVLTAGLLGLEATSEANTSYTTVAHTSMEVHTDCLNPTATAGVAEGTCHDWSHLL